MQRVAGEGFKAGVIAAGIVLGEALGPAGANGEVDEVDERQRLHRREVDGDLVRVHEVTDDDDVDIGEEVEEALDDEYRQGDADPHHGLEMARPGRHHGADAAFERDELAERGEVGGDDGGCHRGDGARWPAEPHRHPHEKEDEERPDDVGRPKAEIGPGEAARQPFLDLADGEHRHRDGAEIERHQVIVGEAVAEGVEAEPAEECEEGRGDEAVDAAAKDDAAEELGLAALEIFRDEAHDCRLETETGEPAENDGADPDDDEDAVFEIAHPAGEQHLADIGNEGGENTYDKGDQRNPLRDGAVVDAGKHLVEPGGKRPDTIAQPAGQGSLGKSDKTNPHGLSAPPLEIAPATLPILDKLERHFCSAISASPSLYS